MPKLIIAEKPSLAKNIAQAIGFKSFTRNDGYYENDDYIVTWGFGHLFGLIDVEEYDPDYDKEDKPHWDINELPFYPPQFRFSLKKDPKTKNIDSGVRKQFNTIKKLALRSDVDAILNAGDADREGEIIVRLIIANTGVKGKPILRLWMPDQTPETISDELRKLQDDGDYDNLANEGYARTFIDWLYGINLTRYATLKSGTLLRVGRVLSPIVKAIYDRDMEIRNFVPEKYYAIVSAEETNGEVVELTSKTSFKNNEEEQADAFCKKYNSVDAIVTDVKTERKNVAPGKLYSLSKLQGVLGKRYKMSLNKSLEIVQKLYEAGYVTYPRTNTEYMATAEKDKVKSIIGKLKGEGFPVAFRDAKSIFDDSKIESHSALTPTTKLPDLSELSEEEKQVYTTIRDRFIAVFCSEPCVVDRTTITIDVGEYETFTLKGDVMVEKGWTQYDKYEKKDKILPKLNKGDIVNTDFKKVVKETTPPKHYTTETLSNYLKNPFRKEMSEDNENDDEEYKAILSGAELGTEATRTSIINNAIISKYISHKNDTYYIEDAGIFYVEALNDLEIDMSKHKTVELGMALKDIYKGTKTIGDGVNLAKKEISNTIAKKDDVSVSKKFAGSAGSIGKCPACGGDIVKRDWGYGCSQYKEGCKFSINGTVAKKKLSEANVKQLLEKGETGIIKGFTSKSEKKFDAKLKLEKQGNEYKLSFAFNEAPNHQATKSEASCSCPNCGGDIKNDKWAWKCSRDCGFSVNYVIAGKELTDSDFNKLVTKGSTGEIKGFKSKSGKKFNAKLVLDENNKTKFEF